MVKSVVEKTSPSSLWHQWHQSDPVKFIRSSLCSDFDWAVAAVASVVQSAAKAVDRERLAKRARVKSFLNEFIM